MVDHYFSKTPKSELKLIKLKAILRKKEIEFYTSSGLFSIKRVDRGSELLADKGIIRNNWKVLDLGCGYGIIGLSLLKTNPTLELTFSDINERAIKLTEINLRLNNLQAKTIQSNAFENIKERFDTILLNPPQTAGKDLCFRLMQESKAHLKKKGFLQIVARHNKGGKELSKKMLEIFNNVKDIAKRSGYRIYLSQNA